MAEITLHHAKYGFKTVDTHEQRLKHMRKRVKAWVCAVHELMKLQRCRAIFASTTYSPGNAWSPRHITECLHRLSKLLGADLLAYAWVAELQERGAVHYHICLITTASAWLPMLDTAYPDRHIRVPLWPYGTSHMDFDRKPSQKYLTDYLEKAEQKRDEFPKGLRIFSVVIRKSVQGALAPRTLFWFRLSAAVTVVAKFIERKVFAEAQWIRMGVEAFIGWSWQYLGGGDWLPLYRGKEFLPVHSEWEYVRPWDETQFSRIRVWKPSPDVAAFWRGYLSQPEEQGL